jgi:hypothetical protein
MKHKGLLAAGALVMALGVPFSFDTPVAKADVISNEWWDCTTIHDFHDYTEWSCNGSWWHGSPKQRSLETLVTATRMHVTDTDKNHPVNWQYNYIDQISSLDGRAHVVTWFCRYSDGTTSASKGTTTVGGGLANTYTWPDFHPCDGVNRGVVAVAATTWCGERYVTQVEINDTISGWGRHAAVPYQTGPFICP